MNKEIKSIQDSMRQSLDDEYKAHFEKQLKIIAYGSKDGPKIVYNWRKKINEEERKIAQSFIDNMESASDEYDNRGINF